MRRPGRIVAAAAAVLVGTPLAGAATGRGVPLARGGRDVTEGVAYLLVLACALALVGWGAVVLVRASRPWWRLLLVPVLVVAVVLGLYVVTVPVWVNATPPDAAHGRAPADVGLVAQDVTLTAGDGAHLAAWYVPSRNSAAVVLLHGSSSSRASVLPHARVLAAHGYGVLLLDAHGHGDSGGRAMLWGWYGDQDVDAALAYLAHRPDVDVGRIALVGMSMGGEEAVGAADSPGVAAVVAEGVTGRTADDLEWLVDAYGWRGQVTRAVKSAQNVLAAAITDAERPEPLTASVGRASTPVLLVVAGRSPDERLAAAALVKAAPETVHTWEVADAPHVGGLSTDPIGWERHVTEFLDAALDTGAPAGEH